MFLLYLVPKNWLSRMVGWAVGRRWLFGFHLFIRDAFIRHFRVDVSEAESPLAQYPTLGSFFIRRLRSGARPIGNTALVSPVDGMLTERGTLEPRSDPVLTQVKGIGYTLRSLLGENWEADTYVGGAFLTLYLAPWNYHRIHAPAEGKVLRVSHIAGALWPVNPWSVQHIPDLFVRNDRVLVEMECAGGRALIALVGATNVGRITLSFCPELVGNSGSGIRDWKPADELRLDKGADLGCFEMGSTVVMILDAGWARRVRAEIFGSKPMPVHVGMDLAS